MNTATEGTMIPIKLPRQPILTLNKPPPPPKIDKSKLSPRERRELKAKRRAEKAAAKIAKKAAVAANLAKEKKAQKKAIKKRRDRNYDFARRLALSTAVFDHTAPKPLAIGILAAVKARLECGHNEGKQFLAWWCHKAPYQRALAAGGPRYSLDGTEAGEVTAEQMAVATDRLAAKAAAEAPAEAVA
jgi:ProP effector